MEPRHECVVSLGKLLESAGVDKSLSVLVSEGIHSTVLSMAWARISDVLPVDDIRNEIRIENITAMLIDSGMASDGGLFNGVQMLRIVNAFRLAPLSVRDSWSKKDRTGYKKAKKASPRKGTIPTGLFGQPHEDPIQKTPGMKMAVAHWHKLYLDKYKRAYTYAAADFRKLKNILMSAGEFAIVARAMAAYIACEDPFFVGHSLSMFCHTFNRWVEQAVSPEDHVRSLLETIKTKELPNGS